MIHTFGKISLSAEKSGVCKKCGKRAKRSISFWQTQNPYNKNKEGHPKSEKEINTELTAMVEKWKTEPVFCKHCDDDNEE